MYEHRSQSLLPRHLYIRRLLRHGLLAVLVIFISLFIGVAGYHFTEGLSWLDSLMNASMILGGMGPVNVLYTTEGKLFASFYALFAGIVFLAVAAILIAPIAHRFLHRLHLEAKE
ncbi:MAG: hypothetical protein OEW45_05850 [Deltaproteobacteria bacterium]|nr:hypothetical protein [Deltaproteobacteria bacterium]